MCPDWFLVPHPPPERPKSYLSQWYQQLKAESWDSSFSSSSCQTSTRAWSFLPSTGQLTKSISLSETQSQIPPPNQGSAFKESHAFQIHTTPPEKYLLPKKRVKVTAGARAKVVPSSEMGIFYRAVWGGAVRALLLCREGPLPCVWVLRVDFMCVSGGGLGMVLCCWWGSEPAVPRSATLHWLMSVIFSQVLTSRVLQKVISCFHEIMQLLLFHFMEMLLNVIKNIYVYMCVCVCVQMEWGTWHLELISLLLKRAAKQYGLNGPPIFRFVSE